MRIWTTLILSISLVTAIAQNVFWAKNAIGSDLDEGNSIAVDSSGNTYITGQFESTTLNFGLASCTNSTSPSYTDVFIAKFDVNGNCLWAKSAGGSESDYGAAIAVDNSGNVFVTGRFSSPTMNFDGTTITNSNMTDIFIAKYNSSGVIQWAKAIGGYYDEEGVSISCDDSNNVYLSGYFDSSSLNFGAQSVTNNGSEDLFLAKFNATGINQWAVGIGGNDTDKATAVKTDNNGNSFITGYYGSPSVSFGTTTLTNSGIDGCLFVAKYDNSGNALWATSGSAVGGDIKANGISIDGNGNSFVAGTFDGSAATIGTSTMTNNHPTYDNTFTAKFDNNGAPQWAVNAISGTEGNEAYCIAADNEGNSFISGWFTPPTVTFGSIVLNGGSFGDNIFLVKYNNAGQVQSAHRFAGTGMSGGYGNSIACDNSGNAFLTGYFEGTSMVFGSTTLTNTTFSTYDVYWTKIAPGCTGIDNTIRPFTEIFPNPCSGQLFIKNPFTAGSKITLIIYSMQSLIVKTLNLSREFSGQEQILVDLSGLTAGVYFLKIETEKEMIMEKLIIEK
ncbi:MAG TPA: SBBP repeat-containing protein [Bacteroidales bacterium]|nr:SBBP repeat-containing protein [Bacteroidales bacterium]